MAAFDAAATAFDAAATTFDAAATAVDAVIAVATLRISTKDEKYKDFLRHARLKWAATEESFLKQAMSMGLKGMQTAS